MRNIHIAFFGVPHAAHMTAVLPILASLVRRGYRVTCVTSEAFDERLTSLGVEVICCAGWADAPSENEGKFDTHSNIAVPNMNGVCRAGLRVLAETRKVYEDDRPDVIMYDLVNFAGRLLAHHLKVPAIQVSPHCAFDEGNFAELVKDDEFREWLRLQGTKADRFFLREGIEGGNFLFHRERLNIYSIPRMFQPSGTALNDVSCLFAGRCPAEAIHYGNWSNRHTEGRPVALVSTSTTYVRDPEYFRVCLRALAGQGWHVVLSMGDGNPADLGPLPDHTEVVRRTAHVKILPFAGLFIFQGGNMSAAEAAFHGVPMIATTFGFAELEWCAETSVVRLGLGAHLRKGEIGEETIRAAAKHVASDPGIQRNVRRVSGAVQHELGSDDIVNGIDKYLDSCLPGGIHRGARAGER